MKSALTTAIAIATLGLGATSAAEEPRTDERPRLRRGSEILMHSDRTLEERSWVSEHVNRLRLGRKGLRYTRRMSVGERDFKFSVVAPGVSRKRYGMGVELRF